jgi:hypothetical protein
MLPGLQKSRVLWLRSCSGRRARVDQTPGSAVLLPDREATAVVTGTGDGVLDDLPTHGDVVV